MSLSSAGLLCLVLFVATVPSIADAGPYAAPGDQRLRIDLQYLDDAGVINIPLTSWPISWGDIVTALDAVNESELSGDILPVYEQVRWRAKIASDDYADYSLSAAAASNPRVIRTFDDTPRENAAVGAMADWVGNRFAANLSLSAVTSPDDGDTLRPDGTYLGVAVGNWMLSAGWQERWWGPGYDGSLILASNARPVPGVSAQRNRSTAFESPWLSWIGPWTLTTFMGVLNDEREVDDALLFGLRTTFRPVRGLELGLSRTAQWCGENRPCNGSAFVDLLLGRDNRGVNVDENQEPGNQLGGIDIRWRLPRSVPMAVYAQWIGEDSRRGGPEIGSWLRQAGLEFWGTIGPFRHLSHAEVSETSCRSGGLGFSEILANCAYEHSIYSSGYRYHGRPLGHSMDGDGLSYSVGSTLVQSNFDSWTVIARHIKLNRVGTAEPQHSLTATPQAMTDIHISYTRSLAIGRVQVGIGVSRLKDDIGDQSIAEASGFLRWSSQ